MKAAAITIQTDSAEQTLALGRRIGQLLTGGEVIALVGPLGAGKTQLVKGIAAGNAAAAEQPPSEVTSPTFVLVNEYAGHVYLYHIDAYRLASSGDLDALGFEEMIRPDSAVVIEWADRVVEALPAERLTIRIESIGESSRRLVFEAHGESSKDFRERIANS